VEGLGQGGGLYRLNVTDGVLTSLVDAAEGVILDCQVSYDGKQILFSWKRTMQTPFEIWRINVDGTGLEKVVAERSNNMNACWLPDGGIAFMSDRKPAFAYCWTSTSPVLFRSDRDGKNPIRLSANYLTDFTPSIMTDGRILFSRW
jgi:Tol biopolymer transport system component